MLLHRLMMVENWKIAQTLNALKVASSHLCELVYWERGNYMYSTIKCSDLSPLSFEETVIKTQSSHPRHKLQSVITSPDFKDKSVAEKLEKQYKAFLPKSHQVNEFFDNNSWVLQFKKH